MPRAADAFGGLEDAGRQPEPIAQAVKACTRPRSPAPTMTASKSRLELARASEGSFHRAGHGACLLRFIGHNQLPPASAVKARRDIDPAAISVLVDGATALYTYRLPRSRLVRRTMSRFLPAPSRYLVRCFQLVE
jgi:hypothetical protein